MCSIDCVIILRLVLNLGVRHARRSLARFSKNAHRGVILVVEDVLAVAEGLSHTDQVLKGIGAFAEGDLALLELVLATDSSKRMQSVLHAVFRVDRSPLLRSVGRVDMLELLNDGLHRRRRPRGARNSPRPPRRRAGGWPPRPSTAASGPRSRSLRPARPTSVPTAAASRRAAAESALGLL